MSIRDYTHDTPSLIAFSSMVTVGLAYSFNILQYCRMQVVQKNYKIKDVTAQGSWKI